MPNHMCLTNLCPLKGYCTPFIFVLCSYHYLLCLIKILKINYFCYGRGASDHFCDQSKAFHLSIQKWLTMAPSLQLEEERATRSLPRTRLRTSSSSSSPTSRSTSLSTTPLGPGMCSTNKIPRHSPPSTPAMRPHPRSWPLLSSSRATQ